MQDKLFKHFLQVGVKIFTLGTLDVLKHNLKGIKLLVKFFLRNLSLSSGSSWWHIRFNFL